MVKNSNIFIVLALVLCCHWSTLSAQTVSLSTTNHVGAYAQFGEWTLVDGLTVGVSGSMGFMYELRVGRTYSPTRFLFDMGLGAGGRYTTSTNYGYVMIRVPVLAGMQYKRFYFLAGGKFDVIPKEFPQTSQSPFDVNVSAEIGFRMGTVSTGTGYDVPRSKRDYRLAAYIDSGVAWKNVSFSVGVKFTFLFQLPDNSKCPLCHESYRSSVLRYPGGGGVQYEE